jgi:hypothetical protein
VQGGGVFNVDGLTPHVEAMSGDARTVQSTRNDGWTSSATDQTAMDWSGTDMDKLDKLQTLGRGT